MSSSNDSQWVLSLRVDRPIEGCELQPHAYLKLKGGQVSESNGERRGTFDINSHFFVFRWVAGPEMPACAREDCPRRHGFNPVQWSKFARGGPSIQCVVCAKLGHPRHETIFCCISCFSLSWRAHSQRHRKPSPYRNSVQDYTRDEDIEMLNADVENEDLLWMEIHHDRNYTPTNEDVGKCLKLECQALSMTGDVIAGPKVVYTEPVLEAPGPPPRRPLLSVSPVAASGGPRFRIVSYNILAEVYATKHAYPYCDQWQINWPYRKHILMQELDDMSSDILCLQEVQADHYEREIKPWLAGQGYDSLYKQKTRESMGQYGKVDGCAIFWRRNKFLMVENYTIEFNECARRSAVNLHLDSEDSHRYINRLSKDNIAQLIVLEFLQRPTTRTRHGTQICVVNTHLYSNHQRPDVKIWQCMTLLREIEQFVMQRDLPLIIAGDFNSEPDSAVYQLVAEQGISADHPELDSDPVTVLPDLHQISHSLELASVYGTALGQEPQYTNYTSTFKGTLDYLWFTPSKLRVLTVSAIPEESVVTTMGEALPSAQYPSDHIAMCCDVQLAASGAIMQPLRKAPNPIHSSPAGKRR